MSNENKIKNDSTEKTAEVDEVSEEQLESVAGGILIGLNQPSLDVKGHKDLKHQVSGLDKTTTGGHIKFNRPL